MDNKNILIIDDSNTNLVLLGSVFKRNNYKVFSALSAKQGLKKIEDQCPDLIYLDLVMPEVDGFEFLKILKSNKQWEDIPVVIISAVSDEEVIARSKQLGARNYLTKPLDIEKIMSLTEEILNN